METSEARSLSTQLERTVRVADQSCSGYASLRDRYRIWSTAVDIIVLLTSVWLCALSFVNDEVARIVTPRGMSKDFWQGLLSTVVFGVSLVQLQVNWKGRSQLYHQAHVSLSALVKECRLLGPAATDEEMRVIIAKYHTISDGLEAIPEREFLKLKRQHKIKVEISKMLDSRPGAPIWKLRLELWCRHFW
jgi:hypothetical protein